MAVGGSVRDVLSSIVHASWGLCFGFWGLGFAAFTVWFQGLLLLVYSLVGALRL